MDDENVVMGADELILHLRKRYPSCSLSNDDLGRKISAWMQGVGATVIELNLPCRWPIDDPERVHSMGLPQTAAQYEFRRASLPDVFAFVGQLGVR